MVMYRVGMRYYGHAIYMSCINCVIRQAKRNYVGRTTYVVRINIRGNVYVCIEDIRSLRQFALHRTHSQLKT